MRGKRGGARRRGHLRSRDGAAVAGQRLAKFVAEAEYDAPAALDGRAVPDGGERDVREPAGLKEAAREARLERGGVRPRLAPPSRGAQLERQHGAGVALAAQGGRVGQ